MFIGHYGLGYIVKKKTKKIPLWMLFASVQLLDLIAFTLVLFGIEKASYIDSNNPFFRNHLVLPYSHSLIGAVIISLIVFLFFRIIRQKQWAWVLGLCVLSHWFIDFIVHTNDLSILFTSNISSLGLWNYPYLTFAIEVIFVITGWIIIKNKNVFSYILLFLMLASFTGMVFSEEPEIMKQNDILRTSVVLFSNAMFIFIAFLWERLSRKRNNG